MLNELNKLASSVNCKDEAIKLFGAESVKDGFYTCKYCGKPIPNSELHIFDTYLSKNIIDRTCKECRTNFNKEQLCPIVCVGCKEVIAMLTPGKDLKTGFERKPNHVYHILECPKCNPDKFKNDGSAEPVKLVEADFYEQKYKKINNK